MYSWTICRYEGKRGSGGSCKRRIDTVVDIVVHHKADKMEDRNGAFRHL